MFKMIVTLLFVFILSPSTFTSVITEKDSCSLDEHQCLDGSCISLNSLCDGRSDCLDGSDEQICLGSNPLSDFIHNRNKRQAQNCRVNQWRCRDGTCIGLDGKCDGHVDCPDFSDETFALCRTMQCQSNWFRCTYGACVDTNAPCNGVQDCADNSDELLPSCRNVTTNTRGQHKCDNGQLISTVDVCDGTRDCADGSDEILSTCAGNKCAGYLFQCAYGACVDEGSNCNGKEECADGSDESDELCNRISPEQPVSPITPTRPPLQGGNCILPPYPKYGTYTVNNNPSATPGKRYPNVKLQISCNPGFQVENNTNSIFCENGDWSSIMPKCLRFCRLNKHPSVEYRCVLSGPGSLTGSRECGSLEPSGTVASPVCRSPNYYSSDLLTNMHCTEGNWDYVAICKPGLTNISIIIDNIEIVVTSHNAQVTVNNYGDKEVKIINNFNNAHNVVFEDNRGRPSSSRHTTSTTTTTTTESNFVYNIDESYWRMGQAQVTRPKNSGVPKTQDPVIYFKGYDNKYIKV